MLIRFAVQQCRMRNAVCTLNITQQVLRCQQIGWRMSHAAEQRVPSRHQIHESQFQSQFWSGKFIACQFPAGAHGQAHARTQDAKAVDISAATHHPIPQQLWRHVRDRAMRVGGEVGCIGRKQAAEPKVCHFACDSRHGC